MNIIYIYIHIGTITRVIRKTTVTAVNCLLFRSPSDVHGTSARVGTQATVLVSRTASCRVQQQAAGSGHEKSGEQGAWRETVSRGPGKTGALRPVDARVQGFWCQECSMERGSCGRGRCPGQTSRSVCVLFLGQLFVCWLYASAVTQDGKD